MENSINKQDKKENEEINYKIINLGEDEKMK